MMDNKCILYLVKIGKKEYLDKTISKGEFYMNTCEYFRERAIDEGGNMVGDLQECSLPQGTVIITNEAVMTSFDKNDPESASLCYGANYCIYCTYAVLSEAIPSSAIIPANVFAGIISNEDPNQYGVLLFKNPATIIEKIAAALSARGLPERCDLVSYDDHVFCSPYRIRSKEYILDLCFHKRKDFEGQNEYRIATINTEKAAIDDLCIGKLKEGDYEEISIQPGKSLHIETGDTPSKITFSWE